MGKNRAGGSDNQKAPHDLRFTPACRNGLRRAGTEYAVIGWPLGHSMSALIHHASFEALGLECRFRACPVPPSELERFMNSLRSSGIEGVAVTIPFKTEVLRYCAARDRRVKAIGAANTIRVGVGGELRAFNTDAEAAGRSLREAGISTRGRRIVVLGAGGAARAICFQMLWEGASVLTIANRTLARAEKLRDDLIVGASPGAVVDAIPLETEALSGALETAHILINTTSVGMYPRAGESPVAAELLREDLAVFDVIYNPLETRLLELAGERGARTAGGADMLVYQAAAQQKIWLGVDAPVELMRNVLLKELAKSL